MKNCQFTKHKDKGYLKVAKNKDHASLNLVLHETIMRKEYVIGHSSLYMAANREMLPQGAPHCAKPY